MIARVGSSALIQLTTPESLGIGAVVAVHGVIPPEYAGDEVANGTQLLDGRHRKINVIKECASHETILRQNRAPAIRLPHCNASHSRATSPKLLM